jgi:MraZ protein
MFLGQFRHNLDDKGRLTVPARFREALAQEGAYIMSGFDQNLMVLTPDSFNRISERLNEMNTIDPALRLLRRLIFPSADFLTLDKAGRILIQQYLRESAGIVNEVLVVGVGNHIELWAPEQWELQLAKLRDTAANEARFSAFDLMI